MVQLILVNLIQFLIYFNLGTPLLENKVWFSQNGSNVCSLCADNDLYQMNVEGDIFFIGCNLDYTNSATDEQLIKSVGTKRFLNPNKYQQDVSVQKGLGIITKIAFSYESVDALGHRNRFTSVVGINGATSNIQPVFVGYHCN